MRLPMPFFHSFAEALSYGASPRKCAADVRPVENNDIYIIAVTANSHDNSSNSCHAVKYVLKPCIF